MQRVFSLRRRFAAAPPTYNEKADSYSLGSSAYNGGTAKFL
jgi:hypothetical protein